MERSCVDGPASATHRGQIPNHALLRLTSFRVENLVCGACVRKIETRLEALPGVVHPRANLSMKTVSAEIDAACTPPSAVIHALEEIGFSAFELDPAAPDAGAPDPGTKEDTDFISQMAVAGFAAANIMLLSVSVWSDVSNEMSAATRATFHWVSAAIAVPTVAYAGQPFFRSALSALKAGRLNMDVPISLGVLLATAMSLAQAWQRSDQVYFDAAVTLLFFLLLGRFLDLRTRVQARSAAAQLLNLRPRSANVVDGDGRVRCLPERDFAPGMTLLVAHGERIGADGCITSDRGEIDESIITGESRPRTLTSGDQVFTGSINIGPALRVRITSVGEQTLLSELGRLMQAAEQRRGTYVRLADKAAAIYAPAVHLLALATVLGWLWLGNGWEAAMTAGIATLIITCPCALALAVPAVQVAASSRLFKQGIIVKSPDGLERLAEVDTIVFDKTGTLTTGVMRLSNHSDVRDDDLQLATSLAVNSRHPYCQALTAAARAKGIQGDAPDNVVETAGFGLSCTTTDGEVRLGSANWCDVSPQIDTADTSLWLAKPGQMPIGFSFEEALRDDAVDVIRGLDQSHYTIEILSGDRIPAVEQIARKLSIASWQGQQTPTDKIAHIEHHKSQGRSVLMVGDGINDAPALASASVSVSPSSAADISQSTADIIFQGTQLSAIPELLRVARQSKWMAMENFSIAIAYNAVFVPLAMMGLITPLLAAVAMSSSSIGVTLNAMRILRR